MGHLRKSLAIAAIVAVIAAAGAFAQSATPAPPAVETAAGQSAVVDADPLLVDWLSRLSAIQTIIAAPDIDSSQLSDVRDDLDSIRDEAMGWLGQALPEFDVAQRALGSLGDAPTEGEPPEAPALALQRADLEARIASLSVPVTQVRLLVEKTDATIAQVSTLRREQFASRILTRGQSPFAPSLWRSALPQANAISVSIAASIRSAVTSQQFMERLGGSLTAIIASVVFSILLIWPVRRWVLNRYGRSPGVTQPDFATSLRATLVVGTTRAVLPTLAAGLVYLAAYRSELLTDAGTQIAFALFEGILVFAWTVAFFRASLSPTLPAWRVLAVPDNFAKGVWGVIIGLAFVFALDILLSQVVVVYSARLAVTELLDYAFALAVGVLLLVLLLRRRTWLPDASESPARPAWRLGRFVLTLVVFGALIAGAIGYVSLARFIMTQLVLTSALVFAALILHRLGSEAISHALSKESWIGDWARQSLVLDDAGMERTAFWADLLYGTLLGLLGIVAALFVWGADGRDLLAWSNNLLFGLQVGNIRISLFSIAVALVVFTGLVILTRIVQRLLADQLLKQTTLDPSVRHSVRIGIGYAGFVLAGLLAFSAVGLDLTNLAIVAGALSVGIGFGLQNIVNNFVSGLILLVSRPVKVGDWIVVGANEGHVKKINVRATEIQTWDHASIFVPNSMLISDAVTNWTYSDKNGRVVIPIGVAYGTNPRMVLEVLLEIGRAHPEVLAYPAPSSAFRGFGDSALDFELRCFLRDVESKISVTSDLCIAIDEKFKELGISIPFPQRDVHFINPDKAPGT